MTCNIWIFSFVLKDINILRRADIVAWCGRGSLLPIVVSNRQYNINVHC